MPYKANEPRRPKIPEARYRVENWAAYDAALRRRGDTPEAEVIIPPRATAVPNDTAASAPTQRDQHIQMIAERGRLGWQQAVRYGRRSLVEVSMLRYKPLSGRSLRARTLSAQKVEARVGGKVLNIRTSLGMPVSRKAT